MIIQKLTNKLQDIGHGGDADKKVMIKILDSYYEIGEIRRLEVCGKIYFVIEVGNGKSDGSDEG
ncbi:hypothetical protein SAMN04487977_101551 [Treponema bryantii]|uniref:Uncharacterized protein n=1 Tax=Treponema bryantii TaxID=163 RepID=A0A1H9B2I7_9SPIR|nr:hypothetical protein SAMN04487977_101551 [Treponema bryantii]